MAHMQTKFDPTLVRRLALLLEKAIEVYNIHTLAQILQMVAQIARAGYSIIAQSILDHLRRLINVKLRGPCPQLRFLEQMAKLRPTQLCDALIALYTLDIDVHVELKPNDAKFHLDLKCGYFWICGRLGLHVESSSMHKLLDQFLQLFEPLQRGSSTLLHHILLYDREALEIPAVQDTLDYLSPAHLKYDTSRGLILREKRLDCTKRGS